MRRRKKVTMKDVAKKAGVSQATVSRVINNHPSVSPERRRIVMEWILKLDYQPNAIAQSLVKNRSYLIGIIIPDISNPYFSEIIQSVEDTAEHYGYRILLSNTGGNILKEMSSIEIFLRQGVDGILISPIDIKAPHLIKLKKKNLPVVFVSQISPYFDSIAVDHARGGAIVADHFVDLGHTNVAFIGHEKDSKLEGFKRRLLERGLEFNENNLIRIEGGFKSYYETFYQLKKLLSKNLKFTAIFACNDVTAFAVMEILEEYGLRVGKDIALVGFDNTFITLLTKPSLTSVSQPTKEIGRGALEILLKRITGNLKGDPISITLEPKLIVRESSGGIDWDKLLYVKNYTENE